MTEESSVAQQLRSGRRVMVNTKGVSMRPLLWQGKTQVLISPPDRPLQVGDISLMFVRTGLSRLHRVIKIDGETVYTRGDNCLSYEKEQTGSLLGIVTEIYRGKRKISMDGLGYRMYVCIWLHSFPVRKIYYKSRQFLHRILRGAKAYVKKLLRKGS